MMYQHRWKDAIAVEIAIMTGVNLNELVVIATIHVRQTYLSSAFSSSVISYYDKIEC